VVASPLQGGQTALRDGDRDSGVTILALAENKIGNKNPIYFVLFASLCGGSVAHGFASSGNSRGHGAVWRSLRVSCSHQWSF
jgi:hypothetical protein